MRSPRNRRRPAPPSWSRLSSARSPRPTASGTPHRDSVSRPRDLRTSGHDVTGVRGVATCIEIALADADAHHTVIGAGAPDHSRVIPERGSLVRKANEGTDRNVNFHLAIPGIVLCFQVHSCLLGGALTDAVNDRRPVVPDWTVRIDLLRLQATTAIATAGRLGHGASPICGGVRALDNVTVGAHRRQAGESRPSA